MKNHIVSERVVLPSVTSFSHTLRSLIISVAGKAFHVLYSSDKSLENTSKTFLQKTNMQVDIDDASLENISRFSKSDRGIIVSNHESAIFSDYLPLFAHLGDEILRKSIFYTGSFNLSMNRREFPDYRFRAANPITRKDVIELASSIREDIDRIESEWGYIFIIPSGPNTGDNAEFQAVFRRMVKRVDNDTPILVNHVHHQEIMLSYSDILKRNIGSGDKDTATIEIRSEIVKSWDWKWLDGSEMRTRYNQIFSDDKD